VLLGAQVVPKKLVSKTSFEQAHLEQLLIQEAQPSKSSNVTLHKSKPPYF